MKRTIWFSDKKNSIDLILTHPKFAECGTFENETFFILPEKHAQFVLLAQSVNAIVENHDDNQYMGRLVKCKRLIDFQNHPDLHKYCVDWQVGCINLGMVPSIWVSIKPSLENEFEAFKKQFE